MKRPIAGAAIALTIVAVMSGQTPKYGVTVKAEKKVDFAKFKTYAWTQSQPSADKAIDAQIVSAVDRELATLGLTKADSGREEVLATYYSLTRSDVDLKAKPDSKESRPYWVGTLVVALLDPASRRQLLRLRVDKPIEIDRTLLLPAIDEAVAALFAAYPTRHRK